MKKKMNKLLSVVLAVLLVAGLFPAAVITASADEFDDAETIAVDSFTQVAVSSSTPATLKFVPAVSDNYRFYTENGKSNASLGLYNDAKVLIAQDSYSLNQTDAELKNIHLYAGSTYYIRIQVNGYSSTLIGVYTELQHEFEYGPEDITLAPTCTVPGKANGVCKHCNAQGVAVIDCIPHVDSDADGLCDSCEKHLSYTITEGETLSFDLISGDTMSVYFKAPATAVYYIVDNYGYYSRMLYDSDGNTVDTVDYDEYSLTGGETYRFEYIAYSYGDDYEINATIRHRHTDAGDGTCSICEAPLSAEIEDDVVTEFTSPARDSVYFTFTPDETGLYWIALVSENYNTNYNNFRGPDGSSLTYKGPFMLLNKGLKYTLNTYNYSDTDETASILISHRHIPSEDNPDKCARCSKEFTVPVAEGEEVEGTLNALSYTEIVFECNRTGSYIINFSGDYANNYPPMTADDEYAPSYGQGYNFTAGNTYYIPVLNPNSSDGTFNCTVKHRHNTDGENGVCSICGANLFIVVTEDEAAEFTVEPYEDAILVFKPQGDGYYRAVYNSSGGYCNSVEVITSAGEHVAGDVYNADFEKDETYYIRLRNSSSTPCEMNYLLTHVHYSDDDDNKCDRCGTEYIFDITEEGTYSYNLLAGSNYFVRFTPAVSANYSYNYNYSGGSVSIDGFYNEYDNYYGSSAKIDAGKTFTIRLWSYSPGSTEVTLTIKHNHADADEDGKCDICGKDYVLNIGLETPVELTLLPYESQQFVFECGITGKYRISAPYFGVYSVERSDGNYVSSNNGLYSFEQGKTYIFRVKNDSSRSYSGTVTVQHTHYDENDDKKCDYCGETFRFTLTLDEKQNVTTAAGKYCYYEFEFTPPKTGNYIFMSNYLPINVKDQYGNDIYNSGSERVRQYDYFALSSGKTYTVSSSTDSEKEMTVYVMVTHAHTGPTEPFVAPGIASNGVSILTCTECGEKFYVKEQKTSSSYNEGEYNDFSYTVYTKGKQKEITINGYYGDDENVVIPAEIKGIPVTQINNISGEGFFRNTKSVVIPEGVRTIGSGAFVAGTFTSITIPDSVEVIEDMAFFACYSLESVTLGKGVKYIGENAFSAIPTGEIKEELPMIVEQGRMEIELETAGALEAVNQLFGTDLKTLDELKEYVANNDINQSYADEIEDFINMMDTYNMMIGVYEQMLEREETSLKEIIYNGSEEEWNNIVIGEDDGSIAGSDMYYGGVKTYTATLWVDDAVFDTITFTADQQSLDLPEVPAKEGYTAKWSDYIIGASDMDIYAVYTAIPAPVNPTAGARIIVKSDEVYKNSVVTVVAKATGVPDGYVLAIYDGGTDPVAVGNKDSVEYKIPGELSGTRTLTVKVIDADKNVQKDASGNDLTANITISIKSGFFNAIIAFFRKLFRANAVTVSA